MTTSPIYIGFPSAVAAIEHQIDHGGWVFVPEALLEAVWFCPDMTPTKILTHPVLSGMEGRLTCDPADLRPLGFRVSNACQAKPGIADVCLSHPIGG